MVSVPQILSRNIIQYPVLIACEQIEVSINMYIHLFHYTLI